MIRSMGQCEGKYDRVRKLPKRFKPLKVYDAECERGLMHTPEYDQRMSELKAEFRTWLLAE
jgi:hypothetical protein